MRAPKDQRFFGVYDIYLFDQALRERGFKNIAGIDEAGRGPLAGPVVAAAVILPEGKRFNGLRDSKKVPEKERETIFRELISDSIDIGIGIIEADVIDRINIRNATIMAMESAVRDLSRSPDLLLIDAMVIPGLDIEQMALIKGESKSASIAAASIIAKVTRDKLMYHYDSIYPEYGFSKHKGYATKEHIEKIMSHGPCEIHRKTFEKVMSLTLPILRESDG
jgi:ribonuclease HII